MQYGLYYLLTCGGFTGSQDVDAAATAFRDVAATNPKYAAAGVVQLREQLLQVGGPGGALGCALFTSATSKYPPAALGQWPQLTGCKLLRCFSLAVERSPCLLSYQM